MIRDTLLFVHLISELDEAMRNCCSGEKVSSEDVLILLFNLTRFPHIVVVFLMYLLVAACARGICVKEIATVHTRHSLAYAQSLSSMLLICGCIIASLPGMITNSYDFQVTWERVWVRQRGGGESKQMAEHCLWPHLLGDLCTQHAHVCVRVLHSNGDLRPYFCLPPLTLIGCHCQVMKGEVMGEWSQPGVMDI